MHPKHPETQRIGGRKRTKPHQSFADRHAESARESGQLARRPRPLNAAADVEERLFGFFYRLDRALDLAQIALERWLVASQIDLVGIFENCLGLLHILG